MKKVPHHLIMILVAFVTCVCNGALADGQENDQRSLPVFATHAKEGVAALIDAMADRKVVLLGDASHGTEEFYAFRKWITRQLIRDHGFRVVVLEAEWDSAEQIDLYIRKISPQLQDSRAFLAAAFARWPQWVWANEEMVEFIEWLRLFNLEVSPEMPVLCFGLDMQLAVGASLAFLQRQFPLGSVHYNRLNDLYGWWQPYLDDPLLFNKAYVAGKETGSLLATELLDSLHEPSFDTKWRLRMLAAAEEYYRTMSYDGYKAWNIRSRYFADYVLDVLAKSASEKGLIVWAHNSHIGDMAGSDVEGTGLINLGRLLRETLGKDKVFILGSASYGGTVMASPEWEEQPLIMDVPPAAEGSVEELLNSGGWENPMLFFRTEKERELWAYPMLHRGIGVAYNAENEVPTNYLVTRVSDRYDALVFWQTTRALAPIMEP